VCTDACVKQVTGKMHHHDHHHEREHHHERGHHHEREQPRFNEQPPRGVPRSSFNDAIVEEARMEVQDAVVEVLATCSDLCQQQQYQFFGGQAEKKPANEDHIEWAQGFLKPAEPVYDDITFEPKFLEPAAFSTRAMVSDMPNVGKIGKRTDSTAAQQRQADSMLVITN
jgi:hypothetical protein